MKYKQLIYSILTLSSMVCLCINFDKVSICVQSTLGLCCNNIIPALFPFFVTSDILMSNFNYQYIPIWIKRVYEKIFGMSSVTLPIFISGLISGYPVGASLSYDLYDKGSISRECAERLISYTNNPGPMFVISVVGIGMYGSLNVGIVLYIIHIISVFVTAILFREVCVTDSDIQPVHKQKTPIAKLIEDDFMKVVKICGYVTIFAILNQGITELAGNKIGAVISILTEITSGIFRISQTYPESIALPLSSFALAVSGMCVCFQVMNVTQYKLSIKKYIKFKLLNGCIAGTICSIYFNLISNNYRINIAYNNSMIINCMIISTYIILGIYFIKRYKNSKNKEAE